MRVAAVLALDVLHRQQVAVSPQGKTAVIKATPDDSSEDEEAGDVRFFWAGDRESSGPTSPCIEKDKCAFQDALKKATKAKNGGVKVTTGHYTMKETLLLSSVVLEGAMGKTDRPLPQAVMAAAADTNLKTLANLLNKDGSGADTVFSLEDQPERPWFKCENEVLGFAINAGETVKFKNVGIMGCLEGFLLAAGDKGKGETRLELENVMLFTAADGIRLTSFTTVQLRGSLVVAMHDGIAASNRQLSSQAAGFELHAHESNEKMDHDDTTVEILAGSVVHSMEDCVTLYGRRGSLTIDSSVVSSQEDPVTMGPDSKATMTAAKLVVGEDAVVLLDGATCDVTGSAVVTADGTVRNEDSKSLKLCDESCVKKGRGVVNVKGTDVELRASFKQSTLKLEACMAAGSKCDAVVTEQGASEEKAYAVAVSLLVLLC